MITCAFRTNVLRVPNRDNPASRKPFTQKCEAHYLKQSPMGAEAKSMSPIDCYTSDPHQYRRRSQGEQPKHHQQKGVILLEALCNENMSA